MLRSINLWIIVLSAIVVAGAIYFMVNTDADAQTTPANDEGVNTMNIDKMLSKYAVVEVKPDLSGLTEKQQQIVKILVEAGKVADHLFWEQASYDGLDIQAKLAASNSPQDKKILEYVNINYGPFDRLNNNEIFYGKDKTIDGPTFYPSGMQKEEFETYIKQHPEKEKDLVSLYTVVRRTGDNGLEAVPFSKAYPEETKKLHDLLMKAASLAENESLKSFLEAKAADFLKDDFYTSDTLWLKLKDNMIDLVIGPTEVYEDTMFNYKASYEAFVMIKDKEATKKLEFYNEHKNALEKRLPVSDDYKKEYKGLSSPLAAVQLVYCGGSSNSGTKTVAFNLPNDEKVREETGSKKVLLQNVLKAKYEKILVPIAETLLTEEARKYISADAFATNVLMHEYSHAFGLNYTVKDPELTVKKALGGDYSAIEECKADIVGLYNQSYFHNKELISDQELKTHYTTAVASIFRSIRFGANGSHGTANLMQFNFFVEKGAIVFDESTGKYSINYDKFEKATEDLANLVLTIQGDGDAKKASEVIEKYGKFTKNLTDSLKKLEDLPVDIVFDYQYNW